MIRSLLFLPLIVAGIVPPAVLLLLASLFTGGRPLYRIAQSWLRFTIGAARVIGGVKYEIEGMENLPGAESLEPVVLASKHQSTWETFAFPSFMPHPLAFVFKRELLLIPLFGWCLGRLDMVHIDRGKRSEAWSRVARQGRELMAKGVWIIMFPEGTRTPRGGRGVYRTGASRLAVDTGANIVPIAVTSGRCWPRRSFRLIPGTIRVSIARPIPSTGREPNELMREVETWIEAEMRRLDPEAYA